MINITIDAEEYMESVRDAFNKLIGSEFLNYTTDDYKNEAIIRHAIERANGYCEDLPFCDFINHFVSLWQPGGTDVKDDGARTFLYGTLLSDESYIDLPYEAFMGKVTPLNKEAIYESKPMHLSVNGLYNYKPSKIFEVDETTDLPDNDESSESGNINNNCWILLHYGEPSITESGTKLINWRMTYLDNSNTELTASTISLNIVKTQAAILEAIKRNPSILAVNGEVCSDGEYIGNFYCEAVHKELIEKVYHDAFADEIEDRLRTLKKKLYNWGLMESETANIIK